MAPAASPKIRRPSRAAAVAPGSTTPAGRAFAAAAVRWAKELREAMRGALVGRDPERVHVLRTTVRRIRALLKAFSKEVPREPRRALDEALHRLGDAANELREFDVLAASVADSEAAPAHPAGRDALEEVIFAQRRKPRARLRKHLLDAETKRLPAMLRKLAARAARTASPPLAVAGAARLPATLEPILARAARWRRGLQTADARALHALRIDAKKARYAAEAYAAAFGKPLARFADALTALQDDLGAIQDATLHGAEAQLSLKAIRRDDGRLADAKAFVAAFEAEQMARVEKIRGRLDRRFEDAFGPRALIRLTEHLMKRAARRAPAARSR